MTELLPVDVQNREDQLLGAAWRRAEAALPEGWRLEAGHDLRLPEYFAAAVPPLIGRGDRLTCFDPDPAEALDRLTAALVGIADRAAGPDTTLLRGSGAANEEARDG